MSRISADARPILLLTFVNAIGGTLLIPVLPFVVRDLGQSDVVFALLIAAYPAAQFFAAPILGSMADHYGRRPVLLVSQAGTLLSWVIFAGAYFATDNTGVALGLLATSRIVDGLTGGNASVAAAYLADVVPEGDRTRVFSAQGAIAGVALLLGPALGSYSAATSLEFLGPALVAIALSLATLIWMAARLEESLAPEHRTPSFDPNPAHQLNLISKARALTNNNVLARLFTVQAAFTFAFSAYTTILALWYVDQLGISETSVGLMMLSVGVFLIFNETVTLRLVEARFGDVGTLVLGLSLLPVALFFVRLPTTVVVFLPVAFVVNAGMALVLPTLQSVVTSAADAAEEGQVQGINTSVGAVASAVAPVCAGAAYASFGGSTTILFAGAAAAVAAGVALASVQLLREAVGETAPGSAPHRSHGPVHALAAKVSGGQRSFGLHLHGPGHAHHALRRRLHHGRHAGD
ncbi:MAG: MFS transporter [Actinomycetota bacterium]